MVPSERTQRGTDARAGVTTVLFGRRAPSLEQTGNSLGNEGLAIVAATVASMDAPPAPLVGSTAQMPALELLRALATSRSSGLLRIGSASPAWAALAEGRVVVAGLATGPTIADALRVAGLLDDAPRDSSPRGGGHDLALLTQLADAGVSDDLTRIVRDHTIAAVFQMLLPTEEQYTFQPGPTVPLARHLGFPMDEIIGAAQDRVRQWAEIAESVPSTQAVFRPRRRLDDGVESVTLERDDWTVLAVLDGRRSVAQTIAATGRGSFEVCSSLHRLHRAGVIERVGTPS